MKTLRAHNMIALADYLECETRWLAIGRGPMERQRSADEVEILDIFSAVNEHGKISILNMARMIGDAHRSIPAAENQPAPDLDAGEG